MEQNPISTETQLEAKPGTPTKPQLWLLGGAILIGVMFNVFIEASSPIWYSVFWLTALAVFVSCNWKRVTGNKTVLALLVPAIVVSSILLFREVALDLGVSMLFAIPALMITIGVFTTQGIEYKREGKAVYSVLNAMFVKTFSAIGSYFRAWGGIFHAKERSSARHGWIGLLIGLPLMIVVLSLLASADTGTAKLLGAWFEDIEVWQWIGRIVVVFIASMLFYSLFFNLTWGKPDADFAPVRQNWKLAGPGVAITMLLMVYALFTYVQFTYLFGGTLPVDLTYSEYARAGFGQFLVVTLINFTVLGISLAKSEQGKGIKVLQTLLIAASLIVLASAAWRMLLYVGVYGLTIRRVMPLWLMLYFVFLAVVGLARVYRDEVPFLRIGAFALAYWYAAFACIDWNTVMLNYNLTYLG